MSATCSVSQADRRDLPMPASPEISTVWPSPPQARRWRAINSALSASRPTKPVSRAECAASKRLSLWDTPSAAYASTGSSSPLTACRPKSFRRNRSPISRRVAEETTTPPESARPWSRAARLGVSPTTTCSCAAPFPSVGLKAPHGFGDVESRMDRARRVILVRAGKAEGRQNPVAKEFRDKSVIARQHARAGVLIGVDDLAHVLGIEPRRQRGRADEVAEHDGELAPLGGVSVGQRGGRGVQRLDREHHLAPMADAGDAEILEIVERQLRQHCAVY